MLRKPLTIALATCLLAACNKKEEPMRSKAEPMIAVAKESPIDTTAANTTEEADTAEKDYFYYKSMRIPLPKIKPINKKLLDTTTLNKINTKFIKEQQKEQKERQRLIAELNKMQTQLNEHQKAAAKASQNAPQPTTAQIDHLLDNCEYIISSINNFADIGIPPTHSHAAKFNKNYRDVLRKANNAKPYMNEEQIKRYNKVNQDIADAMTQWTEKTTLKKND